MIPELSVARISVKGNDFEIVINEANGTSDADQRWFPEESEESRYSRLFAFQRQPEAQFLMNDMDIFQNYSRGVYILIQTARPEQKQCKVFVGMTEDYKRVIDLYDEIKSTNQRIEVSDPLLTLHQCLMEQNQKPPIGMSKWDLAVVIPEHKNTALLYSMLLAIFAEAEGFDLKTKLHGSADFNLRRMHDNYHYFFGDRKTKRMMLEPDSFSISFYFSLDVLSIAIYVGKKIIDYLRNRRRSQKSKAETSEEEVPTSKDNFDLDGDGEITIIYYGDNSPIYTQGHNSTNNITNHYYIINYLNKNFPPESETLSW